MKIHAYYWNPTRLIRHRVSAALRNRGNALRIGNAGDLYAVDFIEYVYGHPPVHSEQSGPRILTVGSVAHKAHFADVICGIGVKDPATLLKHQNVSVFGVRGPRTLDVLSGLRWDLSNCRFSYDPGLLAHEIYGPWEVRDAGRPAWLPHYRERQDVRRRVPPNVDLIDVDGHPRDVVTQIRNASLVVSSSLHGLIFAYAVGTPCAFVRPATKESLFKYLDFFESIGATHVRIHESFADVDLASPDVVEGKVGVADISLKPLMPSLEDLTALGVFR